MKVFAKKATGLKYLKQNQILCNDNLKKYFIQDSYDLFADLIKNSYNPSYYEFIRETSVLKYFLDIEIYKSRNEIEYNNHVNIIKTIKDTLTRYLTKLLGDIILRNNLRPNIDLVHHKNGGYITYNNYFVLSTEYPEYNSERASAYNSINSNLKRYGSCNGYSKSAKRRSCKSCR